MNTDKIALLDVAVLSVYSVVNVVIGFIHHRGKGEHSAEPQPINISSLWDETRMRNFLKKQEVEMLFQRESAQKPQLFHYEQT